MDVDDPKIRTAGLLLGGLVLALALVDFVVLRGESVGGGTVSLRADSEPLALPISHTFEDHTIEIRTRRRSGGESRGRSVAYRLEDPDGTVLVDESEMISRKSRSFSFRPSKTGEYRLHVRETKLVGSGRGTAHVSVAINDRRILSPLLGF